MLMEIGAVMSGDFFVVLGKYGENPRHFHASFDLILAVQCDGNQVVGQKAV